MAGKGIADARQGGPADYRSALARIGVDEARDRADVIAHEVNVTRTTVALARDVGMPQDELDTLSIAARYHDLGKMRVPSEVLRKPGRLTGREWDSMKRHAVDGAAMLASVPGMPATVVEVARYHHERYDGFGYEGLSGEAIPITARIVAIADVHDALRAERDYKPAMREDEALSIMTADVASPGMGRRAFDPVLLRRFVATRLRDPAFSPTEDARAALEDYSRSDPTADLTGDVRRAFVDSGRGLGSPLAKPPSPRSAPADHGIPEGKASPVRPEAAEEDDAFAFRR